MFRTILSNRGLVAGILFSVFIVSGSLLYSWHVRRTTETDLTLQVSETQQATQTATETNTPTEDTTPSETIESPKLLMRETPHR